MAPQLVSIVIPARNAERYLAEAVRSALAQTWRQLDVVVVDDGSGDGTGEVAEGLARQDGRVRVLHTSQAGVSAARNTGLAASRGEFVSFLDADDFLFPDKVERQLAFLELFPRCGLVFSDHYAGDEDLTPRLLVSRRPPGLDMRELLTYRNWFAPFSPLLRASLAQAVGGFDEALRGAEDWDYWIRASRVGAFAYLPGPVGVYRMHPGQAHRDRGMMRAHWSRVADKNFHVGSPEWRCSGAMIAIDDARWHWSQRRVLGAARSLALACWRARSRHGRAVVRRLFGR